MLCRNAAVVLNVLFELDCHGHMSRTVHRFSFRFYVHLDEVRYVVEG